MLRARHPNTLARADDGRAIGERRDLAGRREDVFEVVTQRDRRQLHAERRYVEGVAHDERKSPTNGVSAREDNPDEGSLAFGRPNERVRDAFVEMRFQGVAPLDVAVADARLEPFLERLERGTKCSLGHELWQPGNLAHHAHESAPRDRTRTVVSVEESRLEGVLRALQPDIHLHGRVRPHRF